MTEARDVVVTVREVEKLFCPYTGKHVEVHMLVKPGSITFCAPKAFTLAEPVGSVEELLRRASMRDGVSGVVDGAGARVDVYTGEELRLREFPDGRVCFTGGFNPRSACDSLEEFLYRFTMRDGVAKMAKPEGFEIVKPKRMVFQCSHDVTVSDDTARLAHDVVTKSGRFQKKKTVVSMSRKG